MENVSVKDNTIVVKSLHNSIERIKFDDYYDIIVEHKKTNKITMFGLYIKKMLFSKTNITYLNKKMISEIMYNKIIAKTESTYFTTWYKNYYDSLGIEDMCYKDSSYDALEKEESFEIKIIDKSGYKNFALSKIMDELSIYNKIYRIPIFDISVSEWYEYIDKIYELFERHNLEYNFDMCMCEIMRYVYASVLVHEKDRITLYDLVKVLVYLKDYAIEDEEIINLRKQLCKNNTKIIYFKRGM